MSQRANAEIYFICKKRIFLNPYHLRSLRDIVGRKPVVLQCLIVFPPCLLTVLLGQFSYMNSIHLKQEGKTTGMKDPLVPPSFFSFSFKYVFMIWALFFCIKRNISSNVFQWYFLDFSNTKYAFPTFSSILNKYRRMSKFCADFLWLE